MNSSSPLAAASRAAVRFPDGFAWGVATAAYQNEGAVAEGGRKPSIWDTFAHTPGTIADGSAPDVTCDHYHRFREDVELMAELGIGYYRFSMAWPRVQPDGRGALNPEGVDFYERLVESLLERGIEPWVTLYHWDLPQALEDAGGWPARDTAQTFAEYASAVYERLHDRVRHWTTFNEAFATAFAGYGTGMFAPGLSDPDAALRAAHHTSLGHGLAVRAMRDQGDANSRFGITLVLQPIVPASQRPEDLDAARQLDVMANRVFLDPLAHGRYPEDFRERIAGISDGSFIQPGDEEVIGVPLDVLGVNYYFRHLVRAGENRQHALPFVGCDRVEIVPRGLRTTHAGWEIDPDGMYDLLTRLHRELPDLPLYITENGAAFDDGPIVDGVLPDQDRVDYLDAHFRAVHRAIAEGVDVRGYFVWSLMDNWEWTQGFTHKFGLYHVDFETQVRTPKASALWYAGVTRRNGLTDGR